MPAVGVQSGAMGNVHGFNEWRTDAPPRFFGVEAAGLAWLAVAEGSHPQGSCSSNRFAPHTSATCLPVGFTRKQNLRSRKWSMKPV